MTWHLFNDMAKITYNSSQDAMQIMGTLYFRMVEG